jgi:hypothetical protein
LLGAKDMLVVIKTKDSAKARGVPEPSGTD